MSPNPQNVAVAAPDTLPDYGPQALAQRARQLRDAWVAGHAAPHLAGRNLGLLCEEPAQERPLAIYRAAAELGARVSLVRPRFDAADAATTAGTGRMLGRLYDGVVCVGVAPEVVQAVRQAAGIPILDEADVAASLQAAGADWPHADADEPRFLWQAALLAGLS
jgi:ornithine carbamoyltransferase